MTKLEILLLIFSLILAAGYAFVAMGFSKNVKKLKILKEENNENSKKLIKENESLKIENEKVNELLTNSEALITDMNNSIINDLQDLEQYKILLEKYKKENNDLSEKIKSLEKEKTVKNLSTFTRAELVVLANEKGITGASRKKKEELIQLLEGK